MSFLFDTNITSYIYDTDSPFHAAVAARSTQQPIGTELFVSFMTLFELQYSIQCAPDRAAVRVEKQYQFVQEKFLIAPASEHTAKLFGYLKKQLRVYHVQSDKGIAKYDADLMIASSAIAVGATLVSNDGIFEQLVGLHPDFHLENWAAA